jgi:hypothetical protein
MIRLSPKVRSRPIKFASLVILAAILSGAILALKSIVQQKSEVFQSVDRLPNSNNYSIDSAIVAGVKLDRRVTLAYVRQNLRVMELDSGDTTYLVLRVALPETCGELGCLYIVQPKVGMAKLLQLQELSTGEQMFVPNPKVGCFDVIQVVNKEEKNFPICEEKSP